MADPFSYQQVIDKSAKKSVPPLCFREMKNYHCIESTDALFQGRRVGQDHGFWKRGYRCSVLAVKAASLALALVLAGHITWVRRE